MRWIWAIPTVLTLAACIDFGGKLDTPIEGGNGGALGSSGAVTGGSLTPAVDGGAVGTGTYACDHHQVDSTCTTYASGTTETNARAACDAKLLTTACPTTAAVGRCQIVRQISVYYSDGVTPRTAADAQSACDFSGGVFTR